MSGARDLGLFIVAIFLPPLAVAIKTDSILTTPVLLNVLLTLLAWLPGIIHALYVILH